MLANYRGYLQVDAAPAYDDVFAQHPEIVEVGCWAHARRYFKEAMATAAVPCAQALAIIGQLYGIERAATYPARLVLELTPSEWTRLRNDSAARAAA